MKVGKSPVHIISHFNLIKFTWWNDHMRDYMDRRVTLPKRVTSPTCWPPPPCKQAPSVYLPWQNGYPNKRIFYSYSESYKREKRSKRVSLHLTAMRRDIMGIWYKLRFAELQIVQYWLVHVRIVCLSLHQLWISSREIGLVWWFLS